MFNFKVFKSLEIFKFWSWNCVAMNSIITFGIFFLSVEIPATKQKKLLFQQRDVALAMLYKQQRILVMSHNSRDSPNHSGASVLVYTISYKPNK